MTSQPAAAAATAAIQRVAGYPLYAIFGITHLGAALQRPNLPVVCHQPARHFPADAPACSQNKYLAAAVHPLSPFANGCLTAYLRLISNEIAYHRRTAIHICMNTSIPRVVLNLSRRPAGRLFIGRIAHPEHHSADGGAPYCRAGNRPRPGLIYPLANRPAGDRRGAGAAGACRGDGQHRPGAGTHGGQL